jgi:chloramphenicol O-acetyltransferase type A
MKVIDINNWKGKKHYLWFKNYPTPYYSLTSQVDITSFYKYIKKNNLPFFISFMFLLNKALNQIEEFRLREIDNQVVLYDVIHPAYTIMTNSGVFDNCENNYDDNYLVFKASAEAAIAKAKLGVNENKSYNDYTRLDQFYFTCLPWINFSSVTHPMPNDVTLSVPRIAWGKYEFVGDKVVIALNMQVNHMFIDGYPLSCAYLKFQELLNDPERYLQ